MSEDNLEQYFHDFEKFLEDHPEHRRAHELFQDIADETPRGMVLVIAAEMDRMLGLAIQNFLNDGAGLKELDKDNQGPISTFSSKINLSHALGVISDKEHRDLHLIRRIRNEFAHSSSVSLYDQSIKSRISELSMSSKVSESDKNLETNAAFLIGELAAVIEGARTTNLPVLTRVYGPDAG